MEFRVAAGKKNKIGIWRWSLVIQRREYRELSTRITPTSKHMRIVKSEGWVVSHGNMLTGWVDRRTDILARRIAHQWRCRRQHARAVDMFGDKIGRCLNDRIKSALGGKVGALH